MVHSQLVIKIKLLRSEQGCLFSYPPVLLWINFRFTLFTRGTNDIIRMVFLNIQRSKYMNLLIEH